MDHHPADHANPTNGVTHRGDTATGQAAAATAYTTCGNSLMRMNRPLPRRLLGVWAHPDDEAYLSAGLMARVIDAGGSVTVLTATRGEKGTDDPARYDSDDFGAAREQELRASLARLGVTDVRFMGLRDGECDIADDDRSVARIAATIRDVQPDTIVTFGPDGITHHTDHRAVSRWTTEAWRRESVGDLFYAAMTHDYLALHRELHDRLGLFGDVPGGRPASVGRSRIGLECDLTDTELDRKRAALAEHGSQTAGLATSMGEEAYRIWWRAERFRRPTASEIARCDVPAWIQDADAPERALVGATS